MKIRGLLFSLCFSVMLVAGRPALAESETPKVEANLYQEAMQFIAEGRYEQARETLLRLVKQEPEHAGAWLDIAMLHCGIGNAGEAEALFTAIEQRFSPPPAILEVIAQQRARGCKSQKSSVFVRFRLSRGDDSNANQGARNPNLSIGSGNNLTNLVLSPEFAPKADQFTALSAEFVAPLSSTGTLGLVQFYARDYDTFAQYSLNSLVASVEHPWRLGSWRLRGSGSLGLITLGGALYQRQGQLQFLVTPPLALPSGWKFGVVGGWTRVVYPTLTGFDSQVWESRGELTYRTENGFVQAGAGYAFDHGTDLRPGRDRSGVVASLNSRIRLFGEIFGEFSWSRQAWEGKQAYSPGLIDQKRQQVTQLLRAAVIFPLAPQHAVQVEVRDVRNRENVTIFEYEGRILQASWQWQMGH